MRFKKLSNDGFEHISLMLFVVLLVSVIGTYMLVSSKAATRIPHTHQIVDVSHPNCPGVRAEKGIIGLNKGATHTRNPCVRKEARYIKNYALYVNSSYVGQRYMPKRAPCQQRSRACYAYNYGYKDGTYNLKMARKLGLSTNQWWIDVEEANAWQYDNTDLNRQYLKGLLDTLSSGINGRGSAVGFYSAPNHWARITGNWRNGYPAWFATGKHLSGGARAASAEGCGSSFTGGSVWLVQYIDDSIGPAGTDVNFTCNGSFHAHL